jgi:hypothetical protein
MRNPDTFKGFVYQKKCAFRLLLHELSAETGVIAFRMEHPKGDDFDLIYSDRMRIYQTKDVDKPNMPEYLLKMWRRYTENIKPDEIRQITLGFIFSNNLSTNHYFKDLQKNKMSKRLSKLMTKVNKDKLTKVPVKDTPEWERFLKPITIEVHPTEQIEEEIDLSLGYIFLQYRLPKNERASLKNEFLGWLDEIMQGGKQIAEKELRELIDSWFVRNCAYHPTMRQRIITMHQDELTRLGAYESKEPPISGSGEEP